ncbi:uncharacterized protein CTRU02_205952 [Colletotrichum truncatum]|uniref:Uncharacterized protein n=1 Tax=Colletotrichum truncatum TaxID=5467 RepID=A0ACC3Z5L3_COLTU|nr:uncharacterized protein CTRU02_04784 [Colletotrichum truncatum]KAF6795221.1 hypothetical protein CTRU02_04784 [Colletotrichum truncatum]
MGTDNAEVASRLGSPSPANHRSPIASPSCPVRVRPFPSPSFLSFLVLNHPHILSLPLLPSTPHTTHTTVVFRSFHIPACGLLASFDQPLSLSPSGCFF